MARPSKKELEKREAAKKRVEELLGDTVTVDIKNATEVADKLNELQSSDGGNDSPNTWLESQVEELSKKNQELEDQLVAAKNDYNKLLNTGGGTAVAADPTEIEVGVKKIFNDLRNNYEGNNVNRTKYLQADIRVLLEKFVGTFQFLRVKA